MRAGAVDRSLAEDRKSTEAGLWSSQHSPRSRYQEAARRDVPKIVDWYMDGRINIDDLITHVMPLDRINDGFDLMHRGESIRGVVIF